MVLYDFVNIGFVKQQNLWRPTLQYVFYDFVNIIRFVKQRLQYQVCNVSPGGLQKPI